MQMSIVVKSVTPVEEVKKGKNTYNTLTVTYEKDGKTEAKKMVDFNNPDVFKKVSELAPNTSANVTVEKQGDFWQWTAISTTSGGSMAEAGTRAAARSTSTYETAEERAKKQVYIVRQSSISNALAYLELTGNKKAEIDAVVDVAKAFESYVFGDSNEQESA